MDKHAIVLVSGGLDSATCLAIAKEEDFVLHALSFDYGQRHRIELEAARRVAERAGVIEHPVLTLDLRAFGGSALTADIAVPAARDDETQGAIPVTYVPARNTVFLSLALAFAEARGAFDIYIGANAVDYSGYPDCRPAFIQAFESLANLATKAGVEGAGRFSIHAPLLHMSKAEIIRTGVRLGVEYALTHSCYDPTPEGLACGRCESCHLRHRGFVEAGVPDPTRYAP